MHRKHILVVSTPEFGHAIPALGLAVQLIRVCDCDISFLVSDSIIEVVKKRGFVPADYSDALTLVPLRDGLKFRGDSELSPEQWVASLAQMNTVWDSVERVVRSRHNLPGPQATQEDLDVCPLPDRRIDHIIVEAFVSRVTPHLRPLTIGISSFWPNAATGVYQRIYTFQKGLELSKVANVTAAPKQQPPAGLPTLKPNQPLPAHLIATLAPVINEPMGCEVMLLNTFDGYEDAALNKLKSLPEMADTKVYTVGPLSLCSHERDGAAVATSEPTPADLYATEWLDTQHRQGRPVVYISHGSISQLTPTQTAEFSRALEYLSTRRNCAFLWSLRPPQQQHVAALPHEVFNGGALTLTPSSRAPVLLMGWAPQRLILAHRATQAFVSHCGWNSAIEALSNGVPVIAWPMFAEQFINADMIASPDVGVAVSVPGTADGNGRDVPAAEIVETVESLLGDRGRQVREKASRVGALAREAAHPVHGAVKNNLVEFWQQIFPS
ncbi:hypothetical protein RI367_006406 [Sorochytrium milnesiophthora]